MRILIDECVDQRLRLQLPGHECQTAAFAGFSGLKNGDLLDAAEAAGFDVLITTDQEIPYQQDLDRRRISIMILCAATNRLADLTPLLPRARAALPEIGGGAVVRITTAGQLIISPRVGNYARNDAVVLISSEPKAHMGFTVHGIGLLTYGQRDYWPDGSFVTTEFFVLGWLPIIPLCSKRVSYANNGGFPTYDVGGQYYVYETTAVDRKQALCVYAWFVGLFAPILIWSVLHDGLDARFDEDGVAASFLSLSALVLVLPHLLRQRSKRIKMRQWKRQAMGLGGDLR